MKLESIYSAIESTVKVYSISAKQAVFSGYCVPIEEVPASILQAAIIRLYTYDDTIVIDIA